MLSDKYGIFQHRKALAILTAGLLVRVFAGAIIPPGFDESYYGVYAQYPAWGYFDHPPMVCFTAGMCEWITGVKSPLTLRLGAILLFLISAVLLYEITRWLFSKTAALIAIALFHVTPYFLVGMGAFVIPDNALGVFWLLCLYSLVRLRGGDNDKWLILFGLSAGLALLSKYHAVFLWASLGWCLIFFRDWRKYWRSPYLYIAGIISVVIITPNIVWNYQHEWISYAYQFGKSASGFKVSADKFFQGVFIQAGYLLPWLMYFYLASIVRAMKRKPKNNWLLPFALFPIVVFTLIGATRQILPHWPMPGYLAAIVLTAGMMEQWRGKRAYRLIAGSGIFTVLVLAIIVVQSITGIIPLDKKADLTLDGQGWKELKSFFADEGMLKRKDLFFFTEKWFTGGELAYVMDTEGVVTVFNSKAPNGFPFWVGNASLTGKDGVLVSSDRFPVKEPEKYLQFFEKVEECGELRTQRGKSEGQAFTLYYCENYRGNYPFPYGKE